MHSRSYRCTENDDFVKLNVMSWHAWQLLNLSDAIHVKTYFSTLAKYTVLKTSVVPLQLK